MRALAISLALLFMTLFHASAGETATGRCGLDSFASSEREVPFFSSTPADVDAAGEASSAVAGHCVSHHLLPFIWAELRFGHNGIQRPFFKVGRLSHWHGSPPDYPPTVS